MVCHSMIEGLQADLRTLTRKSQYHLQKPQLSDTPARSPHPSGPF
ncbi:unnamed protein product, partial [Allacma fusca]